MADGTDGPQPQAVMPQLSVLGAIRQGSFVRESERAALAARRSRPAAEINIQVNVNAKPLSRDRLRGRRCGSKARPKSQGNVMFNFELVFAGVFRIQNVPQDSMQPLVLIECPRLLFPFAREIIATAVRNGGFPPLMLDPIDFVALYHQRMAAGSSRRPPIAAGSIRARR